MINKKDENLIERYYNNEPINDMFSGNGKMIYKVLKKYNLPKRIPTRIIDNSKLLIFLEDKLQNTIKKYNIIDTKVENGIRKYKIKCNECNLYYYVGWNLLKHNYTCFSCTKKEASLIASKCKKKKNNTSGFIGVSLIYGKFFIGIRARIVHNKITLLENKYKDEFLQEKTIIQAALDRDIFIIEHKLPHTRNFTDLELFANMEYLAYDNINTLKELLENKVNK